MTQEKNNSDGGDVIATIENKDNPDQNIDIKYFREENAFVTSGIKHHLGMEDIMIPAHLVATDLNLIGAIISSILEKISQAYEKDTTFEYAAEIEVLDKIYTMTQYGEYVKLETKEN